MEAADNDYKCRDTKGQPTSLYTIMYIVVHQLVNLFAREAHKTLFVRVQSAWNTSDNEETLSASKVALSRHIDFGQAARAQSDLLHEAVTGGLVEYSESNGAEELDEISRGSLRQAILITAGGSCGIWLAAKADAK